MLIDEKQYRREITIDKDVIREVTDFFTGKIVAAVKDIPCIRNNFVFLVDDVLSSSDSEKAVLLKGSLVRIRMIKDTSNALLFYCECCGENGKLETVCVKKPVTDRTALILKKTVSAPLPEEYQKKLDEMPTPEQVLADLFTYGPMQIKAGEEFDSRQALREKRLKKGRACCVIVAVAVVIVFAAVGFLKNVLWGSTDTATAIDTALRGVTTAGLFVAVSIMLLILMLVLTDGFVSERKDIWHKLYKWMFGEDYMDAERNDDLYKVMSRAEAYSLEEMTLNAIGDKKPGLLTFGKIRKERYESLELYRTVGSPERNPERSDI